MARSITDVKGIKIGSVEDMEALTGCTVVLTGREGMVCGVDVRGASPGTRETDIFSPVNTIERAHAVLLTGGSAYGLDAAGGVMHYLEERGVGHPVEVTVVPIVPAAVLFDLAVGNWRVRPDAQMGYRACEIAGEKVREGNAGAGAGATVGKIKGLKYCTKGGQGSWSATEKELVVGALVAVNALGDIINPENGKVLAGARGEKTKFPGTGQIWRETSGGLSGVHKGGNTTIAVVACNARLSKAQATKLAQMAHDGLARVINPVHTTFDGDTVFALASGEVEADLNYVGYLAQEVLAEAVIRAVKAAETVQNIKSCRD